jgi:hypothetical protein
MALCLMKERPVLGTTLITILFINNYRPVMKLGPLLAINPDVSMTVHEMVIDSIMMAVLGVNVHL